MAAENNDASLIGLRTEQATSGYQLVMCHYPNKKCEIGMIGSCTGLTVLGLSFFFSLVCYVVPPSYPAPRTMVGRKDTSGDIFRGP